MFDRYYNPQETNMSSPEDDGPWIDLFVAIYTPEDILSYKHWALLIADDNKPLILNVMGSEARFTFHEQATDPQDSVENRELIKVTTIHQNHIQFLRSCAAEMPLSRYPGWNGQDYIIDLLKKARDEDIISFDQDKLKYLHERLEGRSGYGSSP